MVTGGRMLYRIIFSVLPIMFMPKIGYSFAYCAFLVGLLILGTIVSKDIEWIPQLQGTTLVLLYALVLLGYVKGASPSDYYLALLLIGIGYLFSGLEGLSLDKKRVAILFSILFWGFVASGLSLTAYEKMGFSGVVMSIVLITFVTVQDVRKILKRGEERPI